jgi:hypothetical protein
MSIFILFGGLKYVLLMHLSKNLGLFFFAVMQLVYPVFYSSIMWVVYTIFWLLVLHKQEIIIYDNVDDDDDDDDNVTKDQDYNVGGMRYHDEKKFSRKDYQYVETNTTKQRIRKKSRSDHSPDIFYINDPSEIDEGTKDLMAQLEEVLHNEESPNSGESSEITTPNDEKKSNGSINQSTQSLVDGSSDIEKNKCCKNFRGIFRLGSKVSFLFLCTAILECCVFVVRYVPLIYLPGPVVLIILESGLPIIILFGVFYLQKKYLLNHYLSAILIIFATFFSIWPHYNDIKRYESQQYHLFWISLFLMIFSMIPDSFLQLFREKIMNSYQVNFLKLSAWVSLYRIFINILILPVILFKLPEPAMQVSTKDFFLYLLESFQCLFKSLSLNVSDLKHFGRESLWKMFQTNQSLFTEKFQNVSHSKDIGIYSNVSKFNSFKISHPGNNNLVWGGTLNKNETMNYILNNSEFGDDISSLSRWELEAQCSADLIGYFIGFVFLSVLVDICYMFLVKMKGADFAWFCQILQFFPAIYFFSINKLIGHFVTEPVMIYDYLAGIVSFIAFLIFFNTKNAKKPKIEYFD